MFSLHLGIQNLLISLFKNKLYKALDNSSADEIKKFGERGSSYLTPLDE